MTEFPYFLMLRLTRLLFPSPQPRARTAEDLAANGGSSGSGGSGGASEKSEAGSLLEGVAFGKARLSVRSFRRGVAPDSDTNLNSNTNKLAASLSGVLVVSIELPAGGRSFWVDSEAMRAAWLSAENVGHALSHHIRSASARDAFAGRGLQVCFIFVHNMTEYFTMTMRYLMIIYCRGISSFYLFSFNHMTEYFTILMMF
tara:strand:+ start:278 stop:877 length:600 start_codon:yes stop_codon:yes gene_type:complete